LIEAAGCAKHEGLSGFVAEDAKGVRNAARSPQHVARAQLQASCPGAELIDTALDNEEFVRIFVDVQRRTGLRWRFNQAAGESTRRVVRSHAE
jgi:hypothetical protein